MFWLSKLIPDGIDNGFPLLGKAAQDQHRFGGDRIDNVTNLLVVKKQVDELSDLDAIEGDTQLATSTIRYDQVLLLCTLIHPPLARSIRVKIKCGVNYSQTCSQSLTKGLGGLRASIQTV